MVANILRACVVFWPANYITLHPAGRIILHPAGRIILLYCEALMRSA